MRRLTGLGRGGGGTRGAGGVGGAFVRLLSAPVVLWALLATPAPAWAWQTQKIVDPGFENWNGLGLNATPLNWTETPSTLTAVDQIDDETTPRSGTFAVRFDDPTTTPSNRGIRSETFTVIPDRRYNVGVWAKLNAEAGTAGATSLQASVEFYASDSMFISESPTAAVAFTAFEDWKRFMETGVIAPSNAAYATVYIRVSESVNNNNDVFIDDAFCSQYAAADTPNSPTIVSPQDGVETTTPRVFFDWVHNDTEADPQARFWIQIATASSFTSASIVREETQTTATTSWTSDTLPRVVVDTLSWRVRTSNSGDNFSDWSTTETFVAKLRPPGAPTLLSPRNGAETTAARPHFRWVFSDSDGNPQAGFVIELSTSSSFSPVDRAETVTSSDSFHTITADLPNEHDTYFWRVRVFDAAGTSPYSAAETFVRLDTFPRLKIVEVAMMYNDAAADSDYVELYVLDDRANSAGASLQNWTVRVNGTTKITIGSLTVHTGGIVVVSWKKGQTDETTDDGDSVAFIYFTGANDGVGGLTASDRVIDIRDPSGTRRDVVLYDEDGSLGAATQTEADNAKNAGEWTDSSAAGAVSIAGLATNVRRGIQRDTPAVDSNSNADWQQDTLSRGSFPVDRFRVTADSASPTASETFTLTVRALDFRDGRDSYFSGSVGLTVSAGVISPAVVVFTGSENGESQVVVSISGTSGNVTIRARVQTGLGPDAVGETTVNVQVKETLWLNEWLAVPGPIDWNSNGTPAEDGPPADDEWIEIYNSGSTDRGLNGWTIGDAADPRSFTFGTRDTVPARGYYVIYGDSYTFALNTSSADTIYLVNNLGETVDVVTYNAASAGVSRGRTIDAAATFTNFTETPVFFTVSAPAAVSANLAFTLAETAWFRRGPANDTFLTASSGAYNGTATVSVSTGTISPTSVRFVAGETTIPVRISGVVNETVTVTVRTAGSRVSPWFSNGDSNAGFRLVYVQDTPPARPTGVRAVADLDDPETGVLVSWNVVSESDLAGYRVFRAPTNDSRAAGMVAIDGLNADTDLLDSTAVRGETYYYFVLAEDSNGLRSDSSSPGVTAPALLATKRLVAVTVGGGPVTPRPGATFTYEIAVSDSGFGPADSVVLFDTIPTGVVFRDTDSLAPTGWDFMMCTAAACSPAYEATADWFSSVADTTAVRAIRWRKARMTAGEGVATRFRVIVQ